MVKENKITDLVLGLHQSKGISSSFLGNLTEGILTKCNVTTLIYKSYQPLSTIKRHIIIVPDKAEREIGFPFWLGKVWNIARNTGSKLIFYSSAETLRLIRVIHSRHPVECEFLEFSDWDDFLILSRNIYRDDNLIIILSRKDNTSYHGNMHKIPKYLNNYFKSNSFILIYPMQTGLKDALMDLKSASLLDPIEKIDEIGKTIAGLFRKRV